MARRDLQQSNNYITGRVALGAQIEAAQQARERAQQKEKQPQTQAVVVSLSSVNPGGAKAPPEEPEHDQGRDR